MRTQIIILFLSITSLLKAQDTLITYFNSDTLKTTKDSATYYRKVYKNQNNKWAADFYFISGRLQSKGTYISKNLEKKQGYFIYYFENGQKDAEGQYVKNTYDGEWKWYFENGQVSAIETYKKGNLIKMEFWDADGTKAIVEDLENKTQPDYKGGGYPALITYLKQNIVYPEKAKQAGIEGKVYIKFIVGEAGYIQDVKVLKSTNPLFNAEALRVVKEMPQWIPGKEHNRYIKVNYVLPVVFKVTANNPKTPEK